MLPKTPGGRVPIIDAFVRVLLITVRALHLSCSKNNASNEVNNQSLSLGEAFNFPTWLGVTCLREYNSTGLLWKVNVIGL